MAKWQRNINGRWVAELGDMKALEVYQSGQVWKWFAYAGGVAYEKGVSVSLEAAQLAAETEVASWSEGA